MQSLLTSRPRLQLAALFRHGLMSVLFKLGQGLQLPRGLMMNRRKFLLSSAAFAGVVTLPRRFGFLIDNGVDALAAALKFANFDLVSTNYDFRGTALEGRIKPYVVRTVGGIRVGLFGLGISPVALITPSNFKGVTYRDPVVAARDVVTKLRKTERCSLVVCMSHLGYYENPRRGSVGDSQVAGQVDGIDFIASGHSHLFMQQPVKQKQPCGAETLIFQVGKSGIYVGRVDFTFRVGKLVSLAGRLLDMRSEA